MMLERKKKSEDDKADDEFDLLNNRR